MRAFLQRHAAWWPPLVATLVVILPVFGHLDDLPIHMWDESRLATSALEMAWGMNPHPLVTTFGGEPDMWSTKPPLLIWMQAAAIRALGPSELAVRLPSALAALATAALLYNLGARQLRRPWLGTAAVAVLVTSSGYVSYHGIRTGDYDSMLVFFTTAYGLAWWAYSEEPHRKKWFYLAVLGLVGAAMTKGIAGLLAAPVLLLYTLYRRQLWHLLRTPHTYAGVLLFCAVVLAYYFGREHVNPGYIQAMLANDLGRYGAAIEGHTNSWGMYLWSLVLSRFAPWVGWWVIGLCAVHWRMRDVALRRSVVFAALFCGVHLAIITSSRTRIEWYDLPVYPYAAFVAAVGIYVLLGRLHRVVDTGADAAEAPADSQPQFYPRRLLLGVMASALFVAPFSTVYKFINDRRLHVGWDEAPNVAMAKRLRQTVEGKAPPAAEVYAWYNYYPNLDFYLAILHRQGGAGIHNERIDSLRPGQRVAVWQPEMHNAVHGRFVVDTLESFLDDVQVYGIKAVRDSSVHTVIPQL